MAASRREIIMAPLVLEGETLGQKHRQFNSLVQTALADQTWTLENINYNDPDLDNLLKIDVACARKDVPYVLEVMKSTDMLYVTRAIKRSAWLVTEDQYAHIINPDYLESVMFSSMPAKAKAKLLFAIRQRLKDETRIDAFLNYYENDPEIAMKWLPGCSIGAIEKFIKKHSQKLNANQIQRLCTKSFSILKTYCDQDYCRYKREVIQKCTIYLSSNCNDFLDIIDSFGGYYKPTFKKNATQIIMNNCRERVIDNFEKYCSVLHTPTFARNLKPEEVQDFLLKQKQNVVMKHWVKFENVRHFLKHIPKDTRLQFVKSLFIDKDTDSTLRDDLEGGGDFSVQYCLPFQAKIACCQRQMLKANSAPSVTNAHIYRWYRYVPFNTAMTELKKLIYVEPLPAERNAILTVLIKCAGSNQQHLQALLEYYRNKHINEPFNFKIQFVNSLLSQAKTHEFDDSTWNILNNIFSSLEVYMESDNKVPFCINAIIVYKVLHNQDIPEIIEKKFTFSTLKDCRKKLNESQRNKIFTYLFNYLMKILQSQKMSNVNDMIETLNTLEKMLNLLTDWKKNLLDFTVIVNKIKELITIKRQHCWNVDLSSLYHAARPWRKYLFEESLIMHPSDEACINALKHDPGLLTRCRNEMEIIHLDDTILMHRVLRKIRIYWSDSIAQQWAEFYLQRVEQPKCRKTIQYICILMPYHKILPFIKENAPIETKIDWTNALDSKLNMRKNIAKYMHLVRPTVSLDTVLLYAKGNYLYHAMPSVNAVLYNMSSNATFDNMTLLLDAPVSLQKHGICTIFRKLKYKDIKEIVIGLWTNTKNSSIKTILFQQTFKLLCNEKNDATINDLWQLFNMYIESLSSEGNAVIYHTFSKFKRVPIAVRPLFFMKGYLYLKSVSAKPNCDAIIENLFCQASELIEWLKPSFVEDVLLNNLVEKFSTKSENDLQTHFDILTSYILSCKNEETQMFRYEKMLLPILQKAFSSWKLRQKGKYYIKIKCKRLLNGLVSALSRVIVAKQNIIPTKLFKAIQAELHNILPTEENYEILMNCDVATLFVGEVDVFTKDNPQIYTDKDQSYTDATQNPIMPYGCNSGNNELWVTICTKVAATFGAACTEYFKQDALFNQYPALYVCVKEVLRELCSILRFNDETQMKFLKGMLTDNNATTIYCMVMTLMSFLYNSEEVKQLKKEALKILRTNTSIDVKIHISYYENSDLGLDSEFEEDEEQKKVQIHPSHKFMMTNPTLPLQASVPLFK